MIRESRSYGHGPGGIPFVKFTLLYDGPLESSGNKGKVPQQWAIRKQFDPQLRELWQKHPELIHLKANSRVRRDGRYIMTQPHHSVPHEDGVSSVTIPTHYDATPPNEIDLCAPVQRGTKNFFPLVRESLGVRCGLGIQFLRQGPPGAMFQRSDQGGDLDGRIKLLLDALSVPQEANQVCEDGGCPDPLYCLLENDALITATSIATEELLAPKSTGTDHEKRHHVHLIITVEVRVVFARNYNFLFLAD